MTAYCLALFLLLPASLHAAASTGDTLVFNGVANTAQATNSLRVVSTNVVVKGDLTGHSGTFTNLTASVPVETDAAKKLVSGTVTGTGAFVKDTSPTIVTPTIASFANATHSHQNNAGGGVLAAPGITSFANATHTHANAAGGGVLTPSAVGLSDPNADRILFWDDSAGLFAWLEAGSGLTITTTTMTASGGGGGSAPVGTMVNSGASTQYALPYYTDTTGTNFAPALLLTDATGTNFYAGGFLINTLIVTNDVTLNNLAVTTNLTVGNTITVTNGPINLGLTGVSISHDSDGAIGFTGTSAGSDENWTFNLDDTANTVVMSSTSGVTLFDWLTGSFAISVNTIELGNASANTLSASAGDLSIENQRIFRVGGADVPVADGGTGISSGNSGGVLAFTASGVIASSGVLAANAIVVGGGAGVAPSTVTTGAGNLTALALAANATGGFVTDNGTATLSAKSISGALTLLESGRIALDPAGSADGAYSGITVTGTSGYTQAFGDLVYLDPTDSRWEACDANAAAAADGDSRGMIGMVVITGTDGNACTILLSGIIRADANFPSLTINNPVYVSETAGDITQTLPTTEDNVVRIVGAAMTADEIHFAPDRTFIIYDAP